MKRPVVIVTDFFVSPLQTAHCRDRGERTCRDARTAHQSQVKAGVPETCACATIRRTRIGTFDAPASCSHKKQIDTAAMVQLPMMLRQGPRSEGRSHYKREHWSWVA